MARLAVLFAIALLSTCEGYELSDAKDYASRIYKQASDFLQRQEFRTQSSTDPNTCLTDGAFPSIDDCGSYILCRNGHPEVLSCHNNQHFNWKTGKCEDPCSARCQQNLAYDCGWSRYHFTESNDESSVEPTEITYEQPSEDSTGSSYNIQFRCLSDGLYPYPSKCTQFIQCANGYAYVMPCPEGLHFNRRSRRCDYPCNARCSPTLADECGWKSGATCGADEQYYKCTPSCKNTCKNYFNPGIRCPCGPPGCYCKEGLLKNDRGQCVEPEKCPNKKCFGPNEKYSTCVNPCNDCETRGKCDFLVCNKGCDCLDGFYRNELGICIPVDRCPYKAPILRQELPEFPCIEDGKFDYPFNCSSYIECKNNKAYRRECPMGLHFSEQTQECETPCKAHCDPIYANHCVKNMQTASLSKEELPEFPCIEDGKFDYPFNCSSYIQCTNNKAYRVNCPPGLHFSEQTKECESPCKARCDPFLAYQCNWDMQKASSQPIYDFNCIQDGFYHNIENCETYFQCINGKAHLRTCPSMLHFSEESLKCELACDAKCDLSIEEVCKLEIPVLPFTRTMAYDFVCVKDGQFANVDDCGSIIHCNEGYAYVSQCPPNLHFDKEWNRCRLPCDAKCDSSLADACGWEASTVPPSACSLPLEMGNCKGSFLRFYYNASESQCKKFVFGGCDGNENNFESEEECLRACGQRVTESINTEELNEDTWGRAVQDTWRYSRERSVRDPTEDSWIASTDKIAQPGRDSWKIPYIRSSPETTEDFETDSNPQEQTEDSWARFTNSESQTTEDSSWSAIDSSSQQLSKQSWRYSTGNRRQEPNENSWDYSTDSSQDATEDSQGYYAQDKAKILEDFQCPGDGNFPNPDDCESFIQCSLSVATLVSCPKNMHYSEQRDRCVSICLAHCNASFACPCSWPECHQGTHMECESDPEEGPCSSHEVRYYFDRERGKCHSFYYGGCQGNGNNYRSLEECRKECEFKLLGGFKCPDYNGYFGHYPDCMSYYHCKRGIPTLKKCPKGKAFHHLKGKCVAESEAVCVYKCSEPNAVYPVPNDCRSYVDCVNGVAKLEKCPRGLAFHVQKGNCVLERTASCSW